MFEKIIDIIEKHDSIVIYGHINPDGDCYGSAVGLKRTLQLKYPEKKVYITGTGCPNFFSFLMPMDDVSDEVIANSLAILVDANDLGRMEDSRIFNAKAWAKIDHHVDSGSFTEGPSVVVESANSCADIIVTMILEQNLPVDSIVANALYLGILTDSARFQFVEDYVGTFNRVAFLCKHGADPKSINRLLSAVSERTIAAKGYVLTHYKKTRHGVISLVFDKKTLKKLNLTTNEASNLINLVGNIKGYPVWCSFAEYEDGRVRVELRSNGPAVQPVAARIGGGGHMQAAGATIASLDMDYIHEIIKMLDQEVINYKKESK